MGRYYRTCLRDNTEYTSKFRGSSDSFRTVCFIPGMEYEFWDVTLFWHTFLIFWEVVIHCIRKKRKVLFSDIMQLPLSFVLTRFMKLFARIIPVFYGPMRFLILAMGILLTGIGTAMYFNSDLGLLADDGITEAIADLIHKNVFKTKIIFEVCCVIIVIISLSCLHTVIGVGIGTDRKSVV